MKDGLEREGKDIHGRKDKVAWEMRGQKQRKGKEDTLTAEGKIK